jgi:hypothetical protein
MKTAQAVGEQGFNPYATPRAEVADATAAGAQPVFFPVSLLKLTLMSLATLGLYEIYWFYKNWKCVQQNFGDKVNAPIRALFYPLVAYPLFKRIREHAQKTKGDNTLQAGLLASAIFALAALWRLPDPWWMVSLFSFLPLLPVQSTVNEINRKLAPQAGTNTSFSGWNIAGLVLGGILLVLSLVGTFIGE